jgi:hypothetical protein
MGVKLQQEIVTCFSAFVTHGSVKQRLRVVEALSQRDRPITSRYPPT